MNVILLDALEIEDNGEVCLQDRRAQHILTVLGGRVGQSLRIGKINGPLGTGMIKQVGEGSVRLKCLWGQDIPPVPPVDIVLALPRPKVMRRLWSSLAQLGVGRIVLTNAQKVERYYFDSHVVEPSFYNAQLRMGLEQAIDTRMPVVSVHRQLKVLVEDELDQWASDAVRVVADPDGEHQLSDVATGLRERRLLLAVGPEGGWSSYELDLLRACGFQCVTIGPRILRADTACIALLALAYQA